MLLQRLIADRPRADGKTSGLSYDYMGHAEFEFGATHDARVALAKFLELGFEQVLKDDFVRLDAEPERNESYHVFAHRDGFLLVFDTYTWWFDDEKRWGDTNLNGARLHYCWQPKESNFHMSLISSGGLLHHPAEVDESGNVVKYGEALDPPVWAGYHDVREGLAYVMAKLKSAGTILNPWPQNDMNWLCDTGAVRSKKRHDSIPENQAEYKRWRDDVRERSNKNFNALPDWVQKMLGSAPK